MIKRQYFWVLGCCIFLMTISSGCADTASSGGHNMNLTDTSSSQIPAGIHTIKDAINDLKQVLENRRDGEDISVFLKKNYLFRYNLAYLSISDVGVNDLQEGADFDDNARTDMSSTEPDLAIHFLKSITVLEDRLEISSRIVIPYADLPCWRIHAEGDTVWIGGENDMKLFFQSKTDPAPVAEYGKDAERVANDLIFIQQQFKTCSFQEKAAKFQALAKQYREQTIKPAISEEQQKYIVKASLCERKDDSTGAVESYRKAIAFDPVTYPEAYFNLAWLAAKVECYQYAIDYMRQYLLLVPGARNAGSARDNIFEWEIKNCSFHDMVDQFEALAKQYREQAVKPAISEEQRKYIVQANLCTQEKDYTGAIKLYKKVINVDPVTYPGAYFNLAMLADQLKCYQCAIDYMKQYLSLVPDAKDARSAQDKIYEWEFKMKK